MTNLPTPRHQARDVRHAALIVSCLMITGCSWLHCSLLSPAPPKLLEDKGNSHPYTWEEFNGDRARYADGVKKGDAEGIRLAKIHRDHMLFSVIADIDWLYDTFRTNFHGARAIGKTAGDVAKLGLSAASTVLGGSAVLSGAVTALEGAQLSFEKNFLEEKTTAILLTTMDALRAERKADIQRKLAMAPPDYSFDEAYIDALALFNAGTVPSALERIGAESGKEQRDAQKEEKEALRLRVRTTLLETKVETVDKAEKLTDIVADLRTSNDTEKLKSILVTRGVAIPDDASTAQLADLVQGQIRDARSEAETNKFVDQFKTLGIWRE